MSSKLYFSSCLGIKRDLLVYDRIMICPKVPKVININQVYFSLCIEANEHLILVVNSIYRKTKQALLTSQLCLQFYVNPSFPIPF